MKAASVIETFPIKGGLLAHRLFVCTPDFEFEVVMDDPFSDTICRAQKMKIDRALRSSGVKIIEEKLTIEK